MKTENFKNKIEDVMSSAMHGIRSFVDTDVVIGKVIESGGFKIYPLTKVTMGYVAGGGEYYSELKEIKEDPEYPFSAGSGGGVSVQPIAFLVIQKSNVKIVKVDTSSALTKLIEAVPEIAKFISVNFKKEE